MSCLAGMTALRWSWTLGGGYGFMVIVINITIGIAMKIALVSLVIGVVVIVDIRVWLHSWLCAACQPLWLYVSFLQWARTVSKVDFPVFVPRMLGSVWLWTGTGRHSVLGAEDIFNFACPFGSLAFLWLCCGGGWSTVRLVLNFTRVVDVNVQVRRAFPWLCSGDGWSTACLVIKFAWVVNIWVCRASFLWICSGSGSTVWLVIKLAHWVISVWVWRAFPGLCSGGSGWSTAG